MRHALWLTPGDDDDYPALVDRAVDAEGAGWDGVFVSDTLPGPFPDPWVLLAAVAARTETLTLGTWVVPLPRRDPWQVAQEVATLDRLSDGRVVFGAGLGNAEDYEPYGRDYDPRALAARFDEALEVVTGLWAGDPFSYDGDHFTLDDAVVEPTPVQRPRVPILLAGWWPNRKPFDRGARWDGLMPVTRNYPEQFTADELREMVAYYRERTDDPGDVLLAADLPGTTPDFVSLAEDLGVTWLLTTGYDGEGFDIDSVDVAAGPPA